MRFRITRSARKHRIGNAHILAAVRDAGEPELQSDGALSYIGRDDRGIELEIIAILDDRRDGLAIIHAMPTEFRRSGR
jgi:hypothetical protein